MIQRSIGCSLPQVLWIGLLLFYTRHVHASSNSNYNPFYYDLSAPLFTPDGRLLQLEYAANAPHHPLIVAPLNEDIVVLVALSRRSQQQERLVVWRDSVVIGWSGLLPDCLHVQQKLYDQLLDQHVRYGAKQQHTAFSMAAILAQTCYVSALGGGIRPLGVSCWVLDAKHSLYQTDPTGAVLPREVSSTDVQVVGGGSSSVLQRKLSSLSWQSSDRPLATLLQTIQAQLPSNNNNKNKLDLEVVLVSRSKQSVYKLSPQQVEGLLSSRQQG